MKTNPLEHPLPWDDSYKHSGTWKYPQPPTKTITLLELAEKVGRENKGIELARELKKDTIASILWNPTCRVDEQAISTREEADSLYYFGHKIPVAQIGNPTKWKHVPTFINKWFGRGE